MYRGNGIRLMLLAVSMQLGCGGGTEGDAPDRAPQPDAGLSGDGGNSAGGRAAPDPARDGGRRDAAANDAGDDAGPAPDAAADAGRDGGLDGAVAMGQATIDSAGGQVTLEAGTSSITLDIPEGALEAETTIRVIVTDEAVPSGYTAYSPVYRFEPEGLVFAKPVPITLQFEGSAQLAALFWSRRDATGYERAGGIASGTTLIGSIEHFSKGFVADGVDYTEQPDTSCAVTRLLEGRSPVKEVQPNPIPGAPPITTTLVPASVALFFTVDDCQGRPITGLDQGDFVIEEDGAAISSEASPTVLPKQGLSVFASLVLDMSSSTQAQLPEMIAGAKAFVDRLQADDNALKVQIGIQLFSGVAELTEWQAPTLDTARLRSRLDALGGYVAGDPGSTNLYGAVVAGLERLRAAEQAFEARNHGGALTSGYLVLFTDGADTAGSTTLAQALEAAGADSRNQLLAVGLRSSPDYTPAAREALAQLAGHGLINADDPTTLARDFEALAVRIAGQVTRTYLLGYCTPKRAGQHTVSIALADAQMQSAAEFAFDADGFGAGCSAQAFIAACPDGKECGGLGCGACDDRVDACDPLGHCVSHCKNAGVCGGETISNARGYAQVCSDTLDNQECDGACRDLSRDSRNCGDCGMDCGPGGSCDLGHCSCPAGHLCDGICRDLASDDEHCGSCGDPCGPGERCSAGDCQPRITIPEIPAVAGNCPEFENGTITLGGLSGINLLVGPKQATATAPMVVYWHGTGSFANEYMGLAAAVHQGVVAEGGVLVSFQSSSGQGDASCSGGYIFSLGDLDIIDQLVACAVRDHNVDPRRIFTTGCSSGGLFAVCMAAQRSGYVAAVASNSGGLTSPQPFQTANTPALMTLHGAAGTDVVILNFAEASAAADRAFKDRGGFVINCDHGGYHCGGGALAPSIWQFFSAHPFGVDPHPWANGLPAGFAPECVIY